MVITWLGSFTISGDTQFEYGQRVTVPTLLEPWLKSMPGFIYKVEETVEDISDDEED